MVEKLSKLLWTEGLFLGQQHFQQWERTLEERERRFRASLTPLNWGIQDLEIDQNSLKIGIFRLTRFQGIFQNGQDVSLDAAGVTELVIGLPETGISEKMIYVCLPKGQTVQGLTAYGAAEPNLAPWIAHYAIVQDIFDPAREREILFAKLNLQLIVDNDDETRSVALDKYHWMPIAKLLYTLDKKWKLDNTYIPPTIHLHTYPPLLHRLQYLRMMSVAKRDILIQKRDEFMNGLAPVSIMSMQVSLLLQILEQTIAHLDHLCHHTGMHPERAYLLLIDAISKLKALSQDANMKEVPVYDHQNLKSVFGALETLFIHWIQDVIPERLAVIHFTKAGDVKYHAEHIPVQILAKHTLFLRVLNLEEEQDWVSRFLREVKISSIEHLDSIIASALPGLHLTYVVRPPHQLPIKTGYQYFQLGIGKGVHWEKIIKTRSMGVFLSGRFMNADIQLMALEE